MAGFKGQAEYSIDEKGRVALPAKMRRAMSPAAKDTFVATRGMEKCVYLFALDRWEQMEAQFESLNTFHTETRDFLRTITRWADELPLDTQGRIVVPKNLMDFAGLAPRSPALVIGALNRLEIWSPAAFEQHQSDQPYDYATITERVMGGLL
jgi:MraZ protein